MRNKMDTLFNRGDETISSDELIEQMTDWVPKVSVGRSKRSPQENAMAAFEKMSPEARTQFIAAMQAQQTEV